MTARRISVIYRETIKGFWAGRPCPARNRSRSDAPRHPLPHPSRAATWRHARVRIRLQLGRVENGEKGGKREEAAATKNQEKRRTHVYTTESAGTRKRVERKSDVARLPREGCSKANAFEFVSPTKRMRTRIWAVKKILEPSRCRRSVMSRILSDPRCNSTEELPT